MTDSDSIRYSMQRKINDLVAEVMTLQAEVDRLKRYECSWTDCGAQKKNRELKAEVERYRGAIKKWLCGDYNHPRTYRPHDCPHGIHYWQECDNCETEYWQSIMEPPTEKDDE